MNFHGGQLKREELRDYSVNIPLEPDLEGLKSHLLNSISKLVMYPEIDGQTAKAAISAVIGFPENQILLGNGATDLIYLMARSLNLNKVMILAPTFTEYARAFEVSDTPVHLHMMKDCEQEGWGHFTVDLESLAADIQVSGSDALMICNPNNPTGQFFDAQWIIELLTLVKHPDFLLIIDESFIDFRNRGDYNAIMKRLMLKHRILVIRSMTKTYSVPGLRIGYAFGDQRAITAMTRKREPWALNQFALDAIPYFLENDLRLVALQAESERETSRVSRHLKAIEHLTVYPSQANFILFKVKVPDPNGWHAALMDEGVYLRTCFDFDGLDHAFFRVAIKDHLSNDYFLEKMEALKFNR